LILPVSQLQTRKLVTSQIRSHTEYLIQTYNNRLLILHSKLMKNIVSLTLKLSNQASGRYTCAKHMHLFWISYVLRSWNISSQNKLLSPVARKWRCIWKPILSA